MQRSFEETTTKFAKRCTIHFQFQNKLFCMLSQTLQKSSFIKLNINTMASSLRTVSKIFEAREQAEGEGARVRRSIGSSRLPDLDPFLLLDHFNVKPPAGFPDHPHRGFETVTYMLDGSFTHEDFCKHKGTISTGGIQWMTAGRGVLHCEVPGKEGGIGLQLWVNLPSSLKMTDPAYQELDSSGIPEASSNNGVSAKVVAGECLGVTAKIFTRTPAIFLDISLQPGAALEQPVEQGWNAFVYVLEGTLSVKSPTTNDGSAAASKNNIPQYNIGVLSDGNSISFINEGTNIVRFALIAGKPLKEPVARWGPFVMNTQEEIQATISDYETGQNGFENAKQWKSDYQRQRLRSEH